jgi:hypothetical protein
MGDRYFTRSLEDPLQQAVSQFPAVVVTGPRQSGKTTLLRRILGSTHRYVSLEAPDVRLAATSDPRAFLAASSPPVVLDEVQHAPQLLPYIKEIIDKSRGAKGQYVLSGSQNLLLLGSVTETLAGRTAILRLYQMTLREIAGMPARAFPWETGAHDGPIGLGQDQSDMWAALVRGSYPEIVADPSRPFRPWYEGYVQTYLERDVRNIRNVGDLTSFQAFVGALAARTAHLLNLSDVGREVGVTTKTARAWLSVLEATSLVFLLRPYYADVGKRLAKTPKLYFTDTGLVCHLVGIHHPEHAMSGPMRGQLFETLVVSEVYKTLAHRGFQPRIHFWRTSGGVEVDLLVETAGGLVPIEAKTSATPHPRSAGSILALQQDLGERVLPGFVVHPGDISLPLGAGTMALPLSRL